MQIKFKQEIFDIRKGGNLLDFIFSINTSVNKDEFCKEGRCKKCYSIIMNTGSYSTREVLACKTSVYSPIRIVALPKILSKK